MSLIPAEALPSSPGAPRQKGWPVLAWLVILGMVGFVLWRNYQAAEDRSHFDPVMVEMQARYLVGIGEMFGSNSPAVYAQAGSLNRGPYGQRLRSVILAGELAGAGEAGKQLDELELDVKAGKVDPPSPEEKRLTAILRRLYEPQGAGPADPLTPQERQELHQHLDWFGDLAAAKVGLDQEERQRVLAPARRTAHGVFAYLGIMLLLGMAGLVLGVVLLVLWLLGRLGGGLRVGSSHGGLYAETFAAYLLLFFGLSFALGHVPVAHELRPLLSGAAALGALAALGWPVLRGVPWRRVREEIGWTLGRRPGVEPLLGLGCYLAALPLVFIGLITFIMLSAVQKHLGKEPPEPSHPIVEWVVRGGWGVRLQLLFDACVVAPLVEETMFRGVLYRHLREASSRAQPAASVLFSTAVASFVFAVIHPQGLLFVPVLGALAVAFALAREWRGTLIPPMIAHGINNGAVMLLLLVTAG
jgi:membrane protease YdiL (CAAX protease family)